MNRLEEAQRIAERTAKAMRLRKAGVSYDEIGRQLGVDPSVIIKDIQGALRAVYHEEGRELLTIEIERLNMIMFASWSKALEGDPKSVATVLGCIDRRVKLGGIETGVPKVGDEIADRPVKIEIVYAPTPPAELEPASRPEAASEVATDARRA